MKKGENKNTDKNNYISSMNLKVKTSILIEPFITSLLQID